MLVVVDPHSGVPVYRQLMDQVKFLIASGLLKPGDELPSTRALSAELGVNPMTISKAYSYLERDGVVERRPGRALIVKALPDRQIEEQKTGRLREKLKPIVTVVRQLGISDAEAQRILQEMLSRAKDSEAKDSGEATS